MCLWGCVLRSADTFPCQKRASDLLELELQPDVGVENRTWVFYKSSACSKLLSHLSSHHCFLHYVEFVILKYDDKGHRGLAVTEATLASETPNFASDGYSWNTDAAIPWDHATSDTPEAVQ